MIRNVDTMMIEAALAGDVAGVVAALEHGASANANEAAALRCAAKNGYVDIARVLVASGADVRVHTDVSLRDAANGGYTEIVQLLIDHGANSNVFNGLALRWAAMNGHDRIVGLLIANGDIHAHGDSPLRWAAIRGHDDIVRRLLAAGADPLDAYHRAAADQKAAVAACLDVHGAAMTKDQRTALINTSGQFLRLRAMDHASQQRVPMKR